MARVPVPEDHDRSVVTVAGTHDHLYGEADVNLDDRRHARHVKLEETVDGAVGVPSHYAEAVAAFLGTTVEGDSDDTPDGPVETTEVDVDGVRAALDAKECYWCDEYDGENVAQHASSAHREAWRAYKDAANVG